MIGYPFSQVPNFKVLHSLDINKDTGFIFFKAVAKKDKNGIEKISKVPKTFINGSFWPGSVHNLHQSFSLDDCENIYNQYKDTEKIDGIGYIYSVTNKLVGVDIDKAFVNGKLDPSFFPVLEYFTKLKTFVEVSYSGKGLHFYYYCDVNKLRQELNLGDKDTLPCRFDFLGTEIEIYFKSRYFVVTGNLYNSEKYQAGIEIANGQELLLDVFNAKVKPSKVKQVQQDVKKVSTEKKDCEFSLNSEVLNKIKKSRPSTKAENKPDYEISSTVTFPSNEALLHKILKNEKAMRVFEGDFSEFNNDQSLADFFLLCTIARFVRGDMEKTKELFNYSECAKRSKWINRLDYQERTLNAVVEALEVEAENNAKDEALKFWKISDKGKVIFSRVKMIELLKEANFYEAFIFPDQRNQSILVRIVDNVISEVLINDMKSYLKDLIGDNNYILECYLAQQHLFLNPTNISLMLSKVSTFRKDYKEISFLEPTKSSAYFPFRNGIVEITKDSARLLPYKSVQKLIWQSQIIDFTVSLDLQSTEPLSNFAKFLRNTCTDKLSNVVDEKRYNALSCAVGYLLHGHNSPATTKAIIFSEANLSDECKGRTGKGLILQAIGKLKKTAILDGRNFNFNSNFSFSNITLDTKLVLINDIFKKFDFQRLFSLISEGFSFERKGENRYYLRYEQSPKIVITTNFALQGTSESDKARKEEIELLPYYSESFTPLEEFNEHFFTDWNDRDWNAFYFFMFTLCQSYLKFGFVKYNSDTIEIRRFTSLYGNDCYKVLESLITNELKNVSQISIQADKIHAELSSFDDSITKTSATKGVHAYCKLLGYSVKESYNRVNNTKTKVFTISK